MLTDLRLRLLAREVELKSYFGTMIAEDLDEARQKPDALDEQLALLTALVSTSLKASRLLWRYGHRVTDAIQQDEATRIRELLRLTDQSPLAPEPVARFAPLLQLGILDLAEAWNPESCSVTMEGEEVSLEVLQSALRELQSAVSALESDGAPRE